MNLMLRSATPLIMGLTWRRGRAVPGPVVIAGFFSTSTGLGQGSRMFVQALQTEDISAAPLDITPSSDLPADLPFDSCPSLEPGGVLISQFNPPELLNALPRGYWRVVRGRRHIGYWAWELNDTPPTWSPAFAYVDEVWCPSTFTADAVRKAAPPGLPVRVAPYPVFVTPRPPHDRARWSLAADDCAVLIALDLKSSASRKNPQGGMDAYRRAVRQPRPGVKLICKISGADQAPDLFAALQAEARSDIVLVNAALDAIDMVRLIASVDIVLSLHRSEGYGLMAAQGLWLGRCVVATAWSGVMDFLDEDASVPVPWAPTPVHDLQGLYAGGWWAEPDVDAAAAALARLIADPAARAELGRKAQAHADRVFDRDAWMAHVFGLLSATGDVGTPISPS